MWNKYLLVLAAVVGCENQLDEPSRVALEFQNLSTQVPVDVIRLESLVCPEELYAGRELLDAAMNAGTALDVENQGRVFKVNKVAKDLTESKQTITLISGAGGVEELMEEVKVRHSPMGWCVEAGWLEGQRVMNASKKFEEVKKSAEENLASDHYAAARLEIEELYRMLDTLKAKPEVHARGLEAFEELRKTLNQKVTGYAQAQDALARSRGQWYVDEAVDRMTDEGEITATLQSQGGYPNVFGNITSAVLVVRCRSKKLEVFVSTESVIDSRYTGAVSGKMRFGVASATSFTGGISTDHKGVFFNGARAWVQKLKGFDSQVLAIELPIFQRGRHVAEFDLTGSSHVMGEILEKCPVSR